MVSLIFVVIIIAIVTKVKKEKEKDKKFSEDMLKAVKESAEKSSAWTPCEIEAQYKRNEFYRCLKKRFPNLSDWKSLSGDVAVQLNGGHYVHLFFIDGTEQKISVKVSAPSVKMTFGEPEDEAVENVESVSQMSDDELAEEWMKEHKDFMFNSLMEGKPFTIKAEELPDKGSIVEIILDKYGSTGEYNIFQEEPGSDVIFAPADVGYDVA